MKEKSKEKCGGKWELNGIIHLRPLEAKKFYFKLLNMARDVNNKLISKNKENKEYYEIIYENNIFKDLNEINGNKQNIEIFLKKFRAILFDFRLELVWSFRGMSIISWSLRGVSSRELDQTDKGDHGLSGRFI